MKMTSTGIFVGILGGALLAAPFLLYRLLRLPKYSADKLSALFKKATASHLLHRAGLPENTLSALRRSASNGATAVEMDLTFTKDGRAVMLHDKSVDRTSNGSGKIAALDFDEVRQLDFGSKYGSEFTGERIPTLNEVVEVCEELDVVLFLELKGFDLARSVAAVRQLFAERPQLYGRIAVISFNPLPLYMVRREDPKILTGLVQRTDFFTHKDGGGRREYSRPVLLLLALFQCCYNWSVENWLLSFLGLRLLVANKNNILSKKIDAERWRKRGVSLVAWTVNKTAEKEHFQNSLKIPFLTDSIEMECEEQST